MSELEDVQTTVAVIDGLRSRIAALEAEAERLTTWAERSEQLAVDEGSKRAKAEAHAADCKRLVTACENDIDAERMKRREVEAARDEFQQRLLDELAKNALTPTGRDRLEQAEAALATESLKWQDESLKNLIRAGEAEAALAERDRMMQLAYRQAGSPTTEEGAIIGRDEWLADLKARAKEAAP